MFKYPSRSLPIRRITRSRWMASGSSSTPSSVSDTCCADRDRQLDGRTREIAGEIMRVRWLIATVTAASFLIGAAHIPATQAQTPSPPPTGFHLLETTIDEVHSALRSRQTTCRALVELYLKRIQAYDKSGPSLNAIQVGQPTCTARGRPPGYGVQVLRTSRRPALHSGAHQGSDRHERHADDIRFGLVQRLCPTGRRDDRDQAEEGGCRRGRQGDHGGICVWATSALRLDPSGMPTIPGVTRAARPVEPGQASAQTSPRSGSVKTPGDRSAVRHLSAVWWVYGQPCRW